MKQVYIVNPELAKAYEAGATLQELAKEYECSICKVRDALRKSGITIRAAGAPRKTLPDWAAAMYENGASVNAVAIKAGVAHKTVRRCLARIGIKVERRYPSSRARNVARNVARDEKIVHLRKYRGMTFEEIAALYGVSRQRIHQICRAAQ